MKHPLEFLPLHLRKPFFFVFLTLTVLIFGAFLILDQPLRNPVSPNGIVSFELAITPLRAYEIIVSWELTDVENGKTVVYPIGDRQSFLGELDFADGYSVLPFKYLFFGLGFDYLFMPVYALALSFGLLLVGERRLDRFHNLTVWMGWGIFAAPLFDAVENFILLRILISGSVATPLPQIAAVCAAIKFALIIVSAALGLIGLAIPKKH